KLLHLDTHFSTYGTNNEEGSEEGVPERARRGRPGGRLICYCGAARARYIYKVRPLFVAAFFMRVAG
ncbi:MAG: hypothetical protein LBU95_02375, partial [Rikenellaceae bacterium]|nr:hypothetical protein [Rikenellaceae bacterium]